MAEGKGFRVIVKLNDVPVGQYASGNSVIFQGDTVDEVAELIAKAIPGGVDDNGALIIGGLAQKALVQAVGAALAKPAKPRPGEEVGGGQSSPTATAKAATEAAAPAAGATTSEGPASAALLAVAAKKSGKTLEELGDLTTTRAKEIIAAAK